MTVLPACPRGTSRSKTCPRFLALGFADSLGVSPPLLCPISPAARQMSEPQRLHAPGSGRERRPGPCAPPRAAVRQLSPCHVMSHAHGHSRVGGGGTHASESMRGCANSETKGSAPCFPVSLPAWGMFLLLLPPGAPASEVSTAAHVATQ